MPSLNEQLFYAVSNGESAENIKTLLRQGANIQATDEHKRNVFHLAALNGHWQTLQTLIEIADVIFDLQTKKMRANSGLAYNLLSIFAESHNFVENKSSFLAHTLLTSSDEAGRTPLHLAAARGHDKVVKLLLEKRSNINIKDSYGDTALGLASYFGRLDTVKLLLSRNAAIKPDTSFTYQSMNSGNTPLHHAASQGHLPVLKELITHQKNRVYYNYLNINENNREGLTPLCVAAAHGETAVVRYLIDQENAKINQREIYPDSYDLQKTRNTPLMLAAKNGHVETVQLLLRRKANINEKNNEGKTALHLAAEGQHNDVIVALIREGANIHEPDKQGRSPLTFINDQTWLQQTLLELGCAQALPEQAVPLRLNDDEPFPYEYAVMSQQAYQTDSVQRLNPEGWEELVTISDANIDTFNPCGYYAVAWINHATKNIVISHRGTDFHNRGNLQADSTIFAGKEIPDILRYSQQFSQYITQLRNTNYANYTISHTGHSLGSVIAEVEAARGKMHATGFDSIGSGELFELLGLDPTNKNIHIYFSSPNYLNTAKRQVGCQFRLFPKRESDFHPKADFNTNLEKCKTGLDLMQLFVGGFSTYDSHSINNICECFDKSTKMPLKVGRILSWPCAKSVSLKLDQGLPLFKYKMDWQYIEEPDNDKFLRNLQQQYGVMCSYKKEQYSIIYPVHCPGLEFAIKDQSALDHTFTKLKPNKSEIAYLGHSMKKTLQSPAKRQKSMPVEQLTNTTSQQHPTKTNTLRK
jgi:ankyrin repeat protein